MLNLEINYLKNLNYIKQGKINSVKIENNNSTYN
jgi:hypothetical protein